VLASAPSPTRTFWRCRRDQPRRCLWRGRQRPHARARVLPGSWRDAGSCPPINAAALWPPASLPMNLPVGDRRSAPTARPQCSLVLRNTITFALQEWRWSRVGLPISASASWSAGSPLPLSQAGQSFAYGSFPLPSELSASLRQRLLRLELTPDVARRTAKAVEDYPHSKTLTRLPSPSRFFALCHHLAIRTGHCYSLLVQRPRSLSHNGLGLKARNRSRSMHCDRPTAWAASFAKVLGRCPRLHCRWAVGPERRHATQVHA